MDAARWPVSCDRVAIPRSRSVSARASRRWLRKLWYQNIAQFTLDWELPHLDPAAQEASFPLLKPLMEGNIPIDSFDEGDMIVVGDPERCFEKMKHYADLGVDDLICYVQFGYHSGESTLKTIELLGKEVLPELEKYTPVDVGDNLAKFID